MSSKVTFASARPKQLRAEATLPALLDRMLATWNFPRRFKGKRVAIKMHLGGHLGYSTIHPLLVGRVVQAVKDAGGRPFICDSPDAVVNAWRRGYTQEVLGAPLAAVAGPADKYVYPRKVNFRTLKTVNLAGAVVDADALLVLSHGKGHGNSGFAGAIKNIAMGCVDSATRSGIHHLSSGQFDWNAKKCVRCGLCVANCPNKAIKLGKDGVSIFDHACKYCMHCVSACPKGAITIDQGGYRHFQRGMALTAKACLDNFAAGRAFFITALLHVTPFCDCWGFTTPAIVPDVGILAGDDIVAIEQAAIDLIQAEDFIEGSLPRPLKRTGQGHLLQQIHGKDPYVQVEEAAAVGLGKPKYKLVEVE